MRTALAALAAALILAATPALAETCQARQKPSATIKNTARHNPATQQHRLGHLVPATRWSPSIWVGTGWEDGSCPQD